MSRQLENRSTFEVHFIPFASALGPKWRQGACVASRSSAYPSASPFSPGVVPVAVERQGLRTKYICWQDISRPGPMFGHFPAFVIQSLPRKRRECALQVLAHREGIEGILRVTRSRMRLLPVFMIGQRIKKVSRNAIYCAFNNETLPSS